jgi:hypothetical protein
VLEREPITDNDVLCKLEPDEDALTYSEMLPMDVLLMESEVSDISPVATELDDAVESG